MAAKKLFVETCSALLDEINFEVIYISFEEEFIKILNSAKGACFW